MFGIVGVFELRIDSHHNCDAEASLLEMSDATGSIYYINRNSPYVQMCLLSQIYSTPGWFPKSTQVKIPCGTPAVEGEPNWMAVLTKITDANQNLENFASEDSKMFFFPYRFRFCVFLC